jgi:hypothetical protein
MAEVPPRRPLALVALPLCMSLCACEAGPLRLGGSRIVGSPQSVAARRGESPMNEAELQERVQRIAADFSARVHDVSESIFDDASIAQRPRILRQVLLYDSSILDIVTGPSPDTNLLDAIVFADLAGDALEDQLIPGRLGQGARPLVAAFEALRRQVWATAAELLTDEQLARLRAIIASWQRDNPGRTRVEGVRLLDFSRVAGRVASERASEARGLLSTVRSATQTADRALLRMEQGTFLLQRVPFLLRAHVRLGAHELVGDAFAVAHELESLIEDSAELRPILADASALLAQAELSAREGRELSEHVGPSLERAMDLLERGELDEALVLADRVSERTLTILRELRMSSGDDADLLREVGERIDAMLRRLVLYLALLGASFSMCFWGGYYVVQRRLAQRRLDQEARSTR